MCPPFVSGLLKPGAGFCQQRTHNTKLLFACQTDGKIVKKRLSGVGIEFFVVGGAFEERISHEPFPLYARNIGICGRLGGGRKEMKQVAS